MRTYNLLSVLIYSLLFPIISSGDWKNEYEVASGFRLDVDTEGYKFPTAVAFVPQPGIENDSPLYFVTEIRGVIKVVTQDRTIHTFAKLSKGLIPTLELPNQEGEVGMAGLCLDPENGYIFVSYAYEDELGYYRNGITRFNSKPDTFSLAPTDHLDLAPVLSSYLSAVSHQIGPMAILNGHLFVCIGDGEVTANSRNLDSPNGKILRMTLDGRPSPNNPHAVDEDPNNIRNYIWASGFRNPFSIKVAGGRVFVTDNGPQVDRFVEARAGDDFLYDGSNDSLAINPLFLWERSVSPVQMDYNPARVKELRFPGDLIHSFFIAQSGSPIEPAGKSDHGSKTVVALGVDVASGKVTSVPKPLLAYKGKGKQLPVGLALGPDGLYVVPLLPDSDGKSAILKLTYAPENEHAYTIDNLAPEALI